MQFNNNSPIYLQFSNDIKDKIISGELLPGMRMESVRSYSEIYGINPNTVQKALEKLELEDLVFTNRTSGRFITEDLEVIERLKAKILKQEVNRFMLSLKKKNYKKEEIETIFHEILKEFNYE